jgi:phosphoserine aminotransferase
MRTRNFAAGPSCLPLSVLETVKEAVLEFEGEGIGLFEVPHRGKKFERCIDDIKELLHFLLDIPSSYETLLTTGGASLQFSMVPLNLSTEGKENFYLLSGSWSKAALKEATAVSHAKSAGSSEENGFRSLPSVDAPLTDAAYLHYTSNNTIFGTQFPSLPEHGRVPLVCDASSDILSRPFSVKDHALIYAGAQKNLGTPGVTLVLLDRNVIPETLPGVPKLLQYRTYLETNSLYNTPPVAPILVLREVLKWIKTTGGLEQMEKRNREKAKMVYDLLDASELYAPYADPAARSCMNATFTLADTSLEKALITFLEKENCIGLKGHRSVGGFRISMYNAINVEDIKVLCELLGEFERTTVV